LSITTFGVHFSYTFSPPISPVSLLARNLGSTDVKITLFNSKAPFWKIMFQNKVKLRCIVLSRI